MLKSYLPESELVLDSIALPTPCGDVVYFPENLAVLGMQGEYSVFMTMSLKTGQAYIAITQPDRVRFRLNGTPDFILKFYEEIPWSENVMADGNGIFSYKTAPSLKRLEDYFNNLKI